MSLQTQSLTSKKVEQKEIMKRFIGLLAWHRALGKMGLIITASCFRKWLMNTMSWKNTTHVYCSWLKTIQTRLQ